MTVKVKLLVDISALELVCACKSNLPYENVLAVYKTIYGHYDINTTLDALVEVLARIYQQIAKVDLVKILTELLPKERWKMGMLTNSSDLPFNEVIVKYLVTNLMLIERDKLMIISDEIDDTSPGNILNTYLIPQFTVLKESHFT